MNRDFLKGFEGLSDEVIDKIMAENGKDIEKAKGTATEAETKLTAANKQLSDLQKEITELKKVDADGLKTKIADLEKQIKDRKDADEKAVYEKNLKDRFTAVIGDKKFVNDMTKKGIFEEFKAEIEKAENKGKTDKDMYGALVKDRADIFASDNPAIDVPGIGGGTPPTADDNKMREVMGLKPIGTK